MNILVLGSGGREHALAWKISQSPDCENIYIAPGNAGTSSAGINLNLNVNDFEGVAGAIEQYRIDLLLVGPEDPLVNGIRDYLEEKLPTLMIVGPGKKGAMLEGSKDFSKRFMQRHGVPTARAETFSKASLQQGIDYLKKLQPPYVLKADGLAAGKGVIISDQLADAEASLREMLLDEKFGEASSNVLIEEFLPGIELSVFVLCDGRNYVILPEAKDYKRIGVGDTGLNTGGMGAISPVPFADVEFLKKVEEKVVIPTMNGLASDGIDFRGFLFIGLMNVDGEPYVIEYNVRMGDPETQAVIPRLDEDLLKLLTESATGTLQHRKIKVTDRTAATVVMVSGGYPESYEKGNEISGLDSSFESIVFHAGTKLEGTSMVTNGGRVLAVTSLQNELKSALADTYKTLNQISWKDSYFRNDIGQDLLTKLVQ